MKNTENNNLSDSEKCNQGNSGGETNPPSPSAHQPDEDQHDDEIVNQFQLWLLYGESQQ
jgi:hypothetical protein